MFLLLALETAMRMRELYTLDVSQVNLNKRTISLHEIKNDDKRQVPRSKPALDLLKRYMYELGARQFLFPWFEGDYLTPVLRK